jgi:hypothetical protein
VNWQRLADRLMQRPPAPDDERSSKGRQLARLEIETRASVKIAFVQKAAAHTRRIDAYHRIHIGS